MKNNFLKSGLLLGLVVTMAVSCKKKEETLPENVDLKTEKQEHQENFDCRILGVSTSGPSTEGNGQTAVRWPNGSTVKVRFKGGSTFVRNKVKQYAKSWEPYANITFSFVADNAAADVKIGFDEPGYWSYLGTDSKSQTKSMNYGGFGTSTPETEFRRVITHEFGHALGLDHEQAHPDSNIPWNTQAVYDYYMGAPNYWSKEDIDYNVLAVNTRTGLSYNTYDTKSIMHYPVQARFTTNNKAIAPNNTTISEGDIAYVRTYYPGRN
ncbi:M12 family metallopeptidase [Pedobacter miscanthi]|uniref:Peptidase M12 n=1 Tax=Pedobacter miscanthi TaxID=2259170 RepID=A0A366KN54_9SPHI|nr:M12 family metallopeptidase [Pedobacter miscanthi]RBQ03111.1 peptidase M12 [Pedobacter miscanthi]